MHNPQKEMNDSLLGITIPVNTWSVYTEKLLKSNNLWP